MHQRWWKRISGKDQMDTSLSRFLFSSQEWAGHLCRTIQKHIVTLYRYFIWYVGYVRLFSTMNTVWKRKSCKGAVWLWMSHHIITLRFKGIGSTDIHPVILHLMQDSDVVLTVHLKMHFRKKEITSSAQNAKHLKIKAKKNNKTYLRMFSFVLTFCFLLLFHFPLNLKKSRFFIFIFLFKVLLSVLKHFWTGKG